MINEWKEILADCMDQHLAKIIISGPRKKDSVRKIEIRPVLLKEQLVFQASAYTEKQVQHYNLTEEEVYEKVAGWMEGFRQLEVLHPKKQVQVLVSKKGKMTIQRRLQTGRFKEIDLSHNRKKHYILEEGKAVPFLQDLGVMTKEGEIVRTKFDKFRQINRFLEFIEDVLPELPKDREITILDFGCGKSYLTFAIYYYLYELKGYDIRIIGLDLKTDVIYACNQLAKKYGYRKLKFMEGNIADYTGSDEVDMVVTLHACDTATDFALAKAVGWKAKVILSVPCCQHEVNRQIANETLAPLFSYGLIKERMAALVTDAMRAEYLKREGYDTQILEFIDMEHTPKNILIRAIYTGNKGKNTEAIRTCEEMLHIDPMLGRLLDQQNEEGEKGV